MASPLRNLALLLLVALPALGTARPPIPADGTQPPPSLFGGPGAHKLTSYPDTEGNCTKTAQAMAARFGQLTGARIRDSQGDYGRDGVGCDITIHYESPALLHIESTLGSADPFEGMPLPQSLYMSQADCEAALPAQIALFQSQTGLTPFAAYCYHEGDRSGMGPDLEYTLRIDGFGDPKAHVWVYDEVLDGGRQSLPVDLAAQIQSRLNAHGIAVAGVTVRGDLFGIVPTLHIVYYAKQRLPIGPYPITVPTDADCESLVPIAEDLFTRIGEPPLVTYCKPSVAGVAYPQVMVWQVSDTHPGIRSAPRKYRSYAECEDARDGVIADFTRSGWAAFGAICWIDWGGVAMDVYGPTPAAPGSPSLPGSGPARR
jgi:hypothetical protein